MRTADRTRALSTAHTHAHDRRRIPVVALLAAGAVIALAALARRATEQLTPSDAEAARTILGP